MLVVILSIGIFLFFGIIFSIILLVQQNAKKKKLLNTIRGHQGNDKAKSGKSALQDKNRQDLAKKLKESEQEIKKKNRGSGVSLPERIVQAGMSISIAQFWVFSVVSGIVFFLLAKLFSLSPLVVVMLTLTGLLGFPRFVLKFKAKRRQKEFMDDFADSLESMMRLLKAGMPVSEAIKMVAREFTGPMGDEMERVYEEQKIGIPLPEAVLGAAKRMPLAEMQMFATAIAIQTQTGSSLSEVLQNLASVIRSRFKLQRKVKALSSEAKASAMIIGALPVVVALGMYFINREYIEVLFIDPKGKFLLGCAIAWMMVGVLVMRQMINFKV